MTLVEFLTLFLGSALSAYVCFRLVKGRPTKPNTAAKIIALKEIREFQEQLGRLRRESTREVEEFKKAKEKYDEKYRKNRSPKPTPLDDGSDDSERS